MVRNARPVWLALVLAACLIVAFAVAPGATPR